jgi:hypothetical protein
VDAAAPGAELNPERLSHHAHRATFESLFRDFPIPHRAQRRWLAPLGRLYKTPNASGGLRFGKFGEWAIADLTERLELRRRASASANFDSSILPSSA